MKKSDIICFAGNLYDQRPWTNRQQIMTRVACMGYKVLYIEPPKNLFVQLIKLIFSVKPEQNVSKWFKRIWKIEKRGENLYLFSLVKIIPTKYRIFRKLNYLLYCSFVKKKLKQLNMERPVLWIYTPDAGVFAGKLSEYLSCYDCVDNYTSQPWYKNNFKNIEKDELELLKKVTLVFTTSKSLYRDKIKYNPNTYLVHNVGDFNHFIKATHFNTKIPDNIINIAKPIIGFVGAIDDYKLDIDLLSYLANERAKWSIVLIGPVGVADKKTSTRVLRECSNIYFLGERKYECIPDYIKAFDVCIIPYQKNKYTEGCFPIKFFEYLATGKPVVVSGLPELEKYGDIIGFANTKNRFISLIEEYLKNDTNENKKHRIAIAKKNTWQKKTEKQIEIIKGFVKTK